MDAVDRLPLPPRAALPTAPCWLTVRQAAYYLHTSKERILEALASGSLTGYIPEDSERGRIIHTADLDAFVRKTDRPAKCEAAERRAKAMGVA